MKFASTRPVASDIKKMVAFYELVTVQQAEWLAPVFAEIVTPGAALAIVSAETVAMFKAGSAVPGANKAAILEFMVADVYVNLQFDEHPFLGARQTGSSSFLKDLGQSGRSVALHTEQPAVLATRLVAFANAVTVR